MPYNSAHAKSRVQNQRPSVSFWRKYFIWKSGPVIKSVTPSRPVVAKRSVYPSQPAIAKRASVPYTKSLEFTPAFAADTKSPSDKFGLFAQLDLRPSYLSNSGTWYQENGGELGFRAGAKTKLSYVQLFNNNIYDPSGKETGPGFLLKDGFVRGRFEKIVEVPESGFSFGYESRVYLPTDLDKSDRGLVTFVRNYFKLTEKFANTFSLGIWEVPIVHAYRQPGAAIQKVSDGSLKNYANPIFENRVYLIPEFAFANGKVILDLTIIHSATRYRDYQEGAELNDDWGHLLWIYPEITVEVSKGIRLGVAFESDNLVSPDFVQSTFQTGFEKGAVRGILQLSL